MKSRESGVRSRESGLRTQEFSSLFLSLRVTVRSVFGLSDSLEEFLWVIRYFELDS